MRQTRQLLLYVHERLKRQMASARSMPGLAGQYGQALDPDVLTIGFARRFTAYKRPNLLLHDPERLEKIINHPQRPVQLVIAGKAHPADEEGKKLVKAWWRFSIRPEVRGRVVFLSDYDMGLAEQMVQGVDLWVNTPRRPWEACGTSGMKVLVNGGLNVSTPDGWWAEAFRPEVGWAIGNGLVHNDRLDWDACEAEEFYRLLENDIIPCFYERSSVGIPRQWVAKMRMSMAELTPQFSANRMVREYVDKLYAGAAERYQKRSRKNAREAALLCRWRNSLMEEWGKLRFGNLDVQVWDGGYEMTVTVYLDNLDEKAIQVQLYADPPDGNGAPEVYVMEAAGTEAGTAAGYLYRARITTKRLPEHYTPRVVPYFAGAAVPLEAARILWYER